MSTVRKVVEALWIVTVTVLVLVDTVALVFLYLGVLSFIETFSSF